MAVWPTTAGIRAKAFWLSMSSFKILLPLASRVIFLENGSVGFDGPPDRVPSALLESIQPSAEGARITTDPATGAADRSTPVLEVRNLCSAYPHGTFALRDISLTVRRGEFVAILGRNGAGKTTLIRHFNGLSIADSGEVWVEGLNTRTHSPAVLADRIGTFFQNPESQLFADTVREEVGFSLRVKGVSREEIDARVEAVLEETGAFGDSRHPSLSARPRLACRSSPWPLAW